jgi:nucleotide-binding universal stress UspA family protein
MKTLLAAVDFSDASETVLALTAKLASRLGARVILLHVIEPVATYVPVGVAMDVIETAPPRIVEEDTQTQLAQVKHLAQPLIDAGIAVDPQVVVGLSADEIISQAAAGGAELILLGSHGHGALYHLFAGSVVTGVLKRSAIPVVVVPIAKKDAAKG